MHDRPLKLHETLLPETIYYPITTCELCPHTHNYTRGKNKRGEASRQQNGSKLFHQEEGPVPPSLGIIEDLPSDRLIIQMEVWEKPPLSHLFPAPFSPLLFSTGCM